MRKAVEIVMIRRLGDDHLTMFLRCFDGVWEVCLWVLVCRWLMEIGVEMREGKDLRGVFCVVIF